ncbi:Crp/Fnr family transcriptional regulator [Chitinophaga solisilvae]|uniref:Crp/Fnr family transcriptional regulator n=1 Tax=Chitinophaga solisilvae TaxID=1233460 RepID=UPI0019208ACF|nr:Crp/Fnr family transcriptional regulator [Chitinophaga solisilvae]
MTDKRAYYEMLLKHIASRVSITEKERELISEAFVLRRLLPKQYLLQEGDVCRHESFICEGLLRSFYVDEDGMEHTLHFALEDWWIADLKSFIKEEPASRNIIAVEPVILLQITRERREALLQAVPVLERFWRILNESACAAQDDRILQNIRLTGAERYAALVNKYPGLEQRLPLKFIASYLGITPVFLSQIRNNNAGKKKKEVKH